MTFEQMNLDQNIIQALHTLGYEQPLPVQEQVIPNILSGKDCIVKSRTGSGKTASFAIPIIQNLEIESGRWCAAFFINNLWALYISSRTVS